MTADLSDISVRIARLGDSGAIASLRALWKADGPPPPDFGRRVSAWLADERDRRTTWLAIAASQTIGMASLFEYRRMPSPTDADSAWGYIGHLFVHPDWRRRGIGSALLDAIVAAGEHRGYARLVASPSPAALALFGRSGFVAASGVSGADCLVVRT